MKDNNPENILKRRLYKNFSSKQLLQHQKPPQTHL
jgi:hypothetical protein